MGNSEGGIGFAGALFLLFLGLKLGKVIDWSWWWVTAPLWMPASIVLFIFAIWVVIMLWQARKEKKLFEKRWGKGSWR